MNRYTFVFWRGYELDDAIIFANDEQHARNVFALGYPPDVVLVAVYTMLFLHERD